jgi:phosphoglycerate dehydrogenase-like enzyme
LERNEKTLKILTDNLLASMKPTTMFIRTGFAPNHDLLLSMVRGGKLWGYAFDEDHSTFNQCEGNVFASPPLGWLTNEAVTRSAQMWTDAIIDAVQNHYPNRVN